MLFDRDLNVVCRGIDDLDENLTIEQL